MLRVEKTLKISIPREELNVNRLEEILLQEIRCFGKELWESVLASLEEIILTEREGEVPGLVITTNLIPSGHAGTVLKGLVQLASSGFSSVEQRTRLWGRSE